MHDRRSSQRRTGWEGEGREKLQGFSSLLAQAIFSFDTRGRQVRLALVRLVYRKSKKDTKLAYALRVLLNLIRQFFVTLTSDLLSF